MFKSEPVRIKVIGTTAGSLNSVGNTTAFQNVEFVAAPVDNPFGRIRDKGPSCNARVYNENIAFFNMSAGGIYEVVLYSSFTKKDKDTPTAHEFIVLKCNVINVLM